MLIAIFFQEEEAFTPRHRKKGRSSSAKQHRRKKGVQAEDKRVCVRELVNLFQTE